ncbi:hypothetical protein [Shimia sp.]|uniref:hypothetical protein n=1 Tax=Shimia sp. TaxID=1954381 RepID=UPI00329A109E
MAKLLQRGKQAMTKSHNQPPELSVLITTDGYIDPDTMVENPAFSRVSATASHPDGRVQSIAQDVIQGTQLDGVKYAAQAILDNDHLDMTADSKVQWLTISALSAAIAKEYIGERGDFTYTLTLGEIMSMGEA